MRISRLQQGWIQPCGCLVGVYETFHGGAVGIIDQRGGGCLDPAHRIGIPVEPPDESGADLVVLPGQMPQGWWEVAHAR